MPAMKQKVTKQAAFRVAAPVTELGEQICDEIVYALPDPADHDQAIIATVPVLAGGINYGDLVRVGSPDEEGNRPLLEVVKPSGNVHIVAAAEPGEAHQLAAMLERRYPAYALRTQVACETVVSASVHPDLCPGEVSGVIAEWLSGDPDREGEMPAVGRPVRSAA